jgi:hypothetical protein
VTLRPDKRPRPLVIRVAAGDCLDVAFQNLLAPSANPANPPHPNLLVDDQVVDRRASFHAQGLELRVSTQDDGSFVGKNASGLVGPGGSSVYKYYAPKEGTFLVTSHGATFGSDGTAGNSANGMFAVVNVEPPGANFYRSQVTEEELRLCTTGRTPDGQPILNYETTYPATLADGSPTVWALEGKAGLPVLNMLQGQALVHSDLNAVITGSIAFRTPCLKRTLRGLSPFATAVSIYGSFMTSSMLVLIRSMVPARLIRVSTVIGSAACHSISTA